MMGTGGAERLSRQLAGLWGVTYFGLVKEKAKPRTLPPFHTVF